MLFLTCTAVMESAAAGMSRSLSSAMSGASCRQRSSEHREHTGGIAKYVLRTDVQYRMPDPLTADEAYIHRYSGIDWLLESDENLDAATLVEVIEVNVGKFRVSRLAV